MKPLRVAALTLLLTSLGSVIAVAQGDNSCVYPYSFVDPYGVSFGFCLSSYGTLSSLQSPVGNEHLDPVNPLEGFVWYDDGDYGLINAAVVPGFDLNVGTPTVTQPKGPGKLPIVFTYPGAPGVGNGITSTVTVTPADRTIVFTMKVPRYVPQQYLFASGPIYRTAGLLVDGLSNDIFATSAFAAFAYNTSGHGVIIDGEYKQYSGSGEDTGSKSLRYGQTTIEADGWFATRSVSTAVFSYKLF